MRSSINFSGKVFAILFPLLILFAGCSAAKETTVALHVFSPDIKEIQYTVAVLPVENLSGTIAPLRELRTLFINRIKSRGFKVVDEEVLERFMAKYRIRYTGGIDSSMATAFQEEAGADAVLITSFEFYDETYPPKAAFSSRLVSTWYRPEILWAGSVGAAGDDAPKILGLGLIQDPNLLLSMTARPLADSLTAYLSKAADHKKNIPGIPVTEENKTGTDVGNAGSPDEADDVDEERSRFYPKVYYRTPFIVPGKKYKVAVAPFLNESDRKNADRIIMLHFMEQLGRQGNFYVIEPGVVRDELLRLRIIFEGGLSIANANLLFDLLDADLVLTGRIMDYKDYHGTGGTPKVDFSTLILERKSKEIVWSSKSYNTGDDKVTVFDFGKVNTAHKMASEMVRSTVETMVE